MKFFPPEILSDAGDGAIENAAPSDWDQALKYHDLKSRLAGSAKKKVQDAAIRALIKKARAAIGSISRPQKIETAPWHQFPLDEFDLETSLEEDSTLGNLIVERRSTKRAEVIICVDTSLSMTGRKLALTAIALAVLSMQLPHEDFAAISFETEALLIKSLGTRANEIDLLRKFLEVPAKGLTNIEAGLLMAEREAKKGKLAKRAVILMTDGRFTSGNNPDYIVPRLPTLHIVQTGNPWSSPRFCRNLARAGGGSYLRVSKLEQLPSALYSLTRDILR